MANDSGAAGVDQPAAWDALAARLTPAQREAAMHPGSTLVLAGAGTGKTSTLTASVVFKIECEQIPASRILVSTFTNKAAAEMSERIRAALGEYAAPNWLGTFHGLGARQLRIAPEIAGLRKDFEILDAGDAHLLIKRIMKAMNLANDAETAGGRDPVKTIANKISSFKDQLITEEAASARIEAMIAAADRRGEPIESMTLRNAGKIYALYQQRLREANAADFGDLLLWPTLALMHDAPYRRQWAERFDAVLADEYQDINVAQYYWLKAMASHCKRLFAVGDDDQSIYGWRGADVSLIRRFTRDFPNAGEIRLEENFRSTGHILAAANAVIAGDKKRLGKTLYTSQGDGQPVTIATYRDAEAEALGLATAINKAKGDGVPWDHMAVLYRTNALSRAFEEALMRAKIPYELVGDVGFYARQEIKIALAYLRLATHPDDRQSDEAFRRVINEPRRGFGPQAMAIVEEEAAFRSVSMLCALDTAHLPPKARGEGLKMADQVRRIGGDASNSLADQISLLLDACGYRQLLRASKAEELRRPAGKSRRTGVAGLELPFRPRTARPCRACDQPRQRRRDALRASDDHAPRQGPGVRTRVPAGVRERHHSLDLRRRRRGTPPRLRRADTRQAPCDDFLRAIPPRTERSVALHRGHSRERQGTRQARIERKRATPAFAGPGERAPQPAWAPARPLTQTDLFRSPRWTHYQSLICPPRSAPTPVRTVAHAASCASPFRTDASTIPRRPQSPVKSSI